MDKWTSTDQHFVKANRDIQTMFFGLHERAGKSRTSQEHSSHTPSSGQSRLALAGWSLPRVTVTETAGAGRRASVCASASSTEVVTCIEVIRIQSPLAICPQLYSPRSLSLSLFFFCKNKSPFIFGGRNGSGIIP